MMHGFIFTEIKRYVETSVGSGAWLQVLDQAGLGAKEYMNGVHYPDAEAVSIVTAAATATATPITEVLKGFGRFLSHDLFRTFRPLIDPGWRTLDFLENVEATIHRVVRARNPQAKPPALVCQRVSDTEVRIDYRSPRKMCALAQGIVLGVAEHYGEKIALTEEACMHKGDAICRISVTLTRDDQKVGEKVKGEDTRPVERPDWDSLGIDLAQDPRSAAPEKHLAPRPAKPVADPHETASPRRE